MTDRPVADREPLSAEWRVDAIRAVLASREGFRDDEPIWSDQAVRLLLATLDAARSPDEAGLREALDWMRRVIDRHSDECTVLRTASEGGAETDLDSAFGDVTLAFEEGPLLRAALAQPAVPVADEAGLRAFDEAHKVAASCDLAPRLCASCAIRLMETGAALLDAAQPAVPVAGAEDMETCPTCWQPVPSPQRGDHDYGIPLRAAQPEDDGLDVERLRTILRDEMLCVPTEGEHHTEDYIDSVVARLTPSEPSDGATG